MTPRVVALWLLALATPLGVSAHAILEESSPAAGTAVEAGERDVVLEFNGPLDPSKSSFEVRGPDGAEVGTGGVDADDPSRMVGAIATVAVGEHEIRWTGVADDGHNEIKRGVVAFSTVEPAPTAVATATATATAPSATTNASTGASASAAPAATPSASSDPAPTGGSGSDVLIPIVAALVVVGGLAFALLRRGRAA